MRRDSSIILSPSHCTSGLRQTFICKQQAEDYEQHRYQQPNGRFDPKWNYDGMIEDAQLGFYAGPSIADTPKAARVEPGR